MHNRLQRKSNTIALLSAALAFALVKPSVAQDINCEDSGGMNQSEMNICARLDYERADVALNVAWRKVLPEMQKLGPDEAKYSSNGLGAGENMLNAQRAWIKYRDAHCDADGARFTNGTMRPLIYYGCMAALTRKRTEELLLLLEEF